MGKLFKRIHIPAGGSMKRKLFLYMLVLLIFILLLLASLLSLLGQFKTPKTSLLEACDMQQAVLGKEIKTHRNSLAMMNIHFSEDLSLSIDSWLEKNNLDFSALTDSPERVESLEGAIFETVRQYLLQAECSGAFMMLDTTVKSSAKDSEFSKSGIYLQVNGYEMSRRDVLCYRGSSTVSKAHNVMPHRKWRLELRRKYFEAYDVAKEKMDQPLDKACTFTDFMTMPGMSERAMHIVIPVTGSDGTYYGACGFEISESYFQQMFRQPARYPRMFSLLSNGNIDAGNDTGGSDTHLALQNYFACGNTSGYYYLPKSKLSIIDYGKGLTLFTDGKESYVGTIKTCEGYRTKEKFTTAVMLPKEDLTHEMASTGLRVAILILLLTVPSIICCLYFTSRFLKPLFYGIELIQKGDFSAQRSNVLEIDDLMDFLSQKDGETEKKIKGLETKIGNLQRSRQVDISEDDYQYFQSNFATLTSKEKEVFMLYLDGKTSKQIQEICNISANTLKYHNANIYSKLGINSRKQLLAYASKMRDEKTCS